MELLLLVLGGIILFGATTTVRIVNQGDQILIERLGRFHSRWAPGLHFLVPLIDRIAYRETTKEQVLDVQPQKCITSDNVSLEADAIVYWRIMDMERACYAVADIRAALVNLVLTALRSEIGKLELDETFSSRAEINQTLLLQLDEATDPWGIKVTRVEVKNITPSRTVLDSMELQMAAERKKRAVILDSEGDKQSKINTAEGAAQSALIAAEADKKQQLLRAEGTAQALKAIAETLNNPLAREALQFYLAQDYLDTAQQVGKSPSSKVVFLDPASMTGALSGLMNILSNTPEASYTPLNLPQGTNLRDYYAKNPVRPAQPPHES
ncbi:SPFH domain-containing protein [Anthocerotibacter panamensis]|uniref:SPFH domain-containing protein n=1 Tax=Anthocerotibacter panamensis TaxID=2857077 RepID=UPI001C403099|nr:SPFH domain-containing protein [Anthocerotibacter panamensis]